MLKVNIDTKELERSTKDFAENKLKDTAVKAANKTVNETRTEAINLITETKEIKKNTLKKRILTFKATKSKPSASLLISNRGVPLIAFKPRTEEISSRRGRRFGVSTTAYGAREIVPGGFIAEMPSGKTGIFKRTTINRLPIREQFGTSPAFIFNKDGGLQSRLYAYANRQLTKNFIFGLRQKK